MSNTHKNILLLSPRKHVIGNDCIGRKRDAIQELMKIAENTYHIRILHTQLVIIAFQSR